MTPPIDCSQNRDPLRLVREGTSRDQRLAPALDPQDPAYPLVNERTIAHGMVFARAYSAFLKYYDSNNALAGTWKPFFSEDVSVRLAVAAVQNVAAYQQNIREWLIFLSDRKNETDDETVKAGLRDRLDYLFSCCATLAINLDLLKEKLPEEIALKETLQNLVRTQLAPVLKRLIAYRRGGEDVPGDDFERPINDSANEKPAPLKILDGDAVKFSDLSAADLSEDWSGGAAWAAYYGNIPGDDSVYGILDNPKLFDRANHIANHNLFTSILDQFLKVYARTVGDAKQALDDTLTKWDRHEPHYALFLAFLRLLEFARAEANTLTQKHLDFYYRDILGLKEKPSQPGKAHLLVELAKLVGSHELKSGERFKAGKDDRGVDVFFANDRDFVANQAKVAALKTVYRHGNEPVGVSAPTDIHRGRLYASPIANSEDGLGAELTAVDQSWHPLHNMSYQDGMLAEINMPKAEVGFAIASHHLLLAGGQRTVTVGLSVTPPFAGLTGDHKDDIVCLFTTEKGWMDKQTSRFNLQNGVLTLEIVLSGSDPPVVPYSAKVHGRNFSTSLPILLVSLRHRDAVEYLYAVLEDAAIQGIDLTIEVEGLKTLALSNDFGPVDNSKPFQPFGALPVANSALVIGSNEAFQKKLSSAAINVKWQNKPAPYDNTKVNVNTEYLKAGQWEPSHIDLKDITELDIAKYSQKGVGNPSDFEARETKPRGMDSKFEIFNETSGSPLDDESTPYIDAPDLSELEHYNASSRHGFVRLLIDHDFGQGPYEQALIDYIKRVTDGVADNEGQKPIPPIGPFVAEMTLDYTAKQKIVLDSSDKSKFETRPSHFFHITPFGHAEQHPCLKTFIPDNDAHIADKAIYLLPQLKHLNVADATISEGASVWHEAEFTIGVTGLKPPQNLTLFFQVTDGTADPRSAKPPFHIHWSYLQGNEWISFARDAVNDRTDELLNSGIITFAMPRGASDDNTLLPSGMHWIKAAVGSASDAVCRLRMVAAQALEATFADQGNDPEFGAKVLPPGTITKLERPDGAVKKITQPFPTIGGRGKETPTAFYTRVSERLRHKDRAIDLWDYERLVLEAFPQIYKVKCLNHTQYEPNESATDIYRELAPGHVTLVTIPNQQFHHVRDPLRPFTSLGLLAEIQAFLRRRVSCFVNLHVRNPLFEEVLVDLKVRFRAGVDVTFHVNKLQEAMIRFLSPWAFPGGGNPSFGGKVRKSALINFVEEQLYVDYVTDFKLSHLFEDSNGVTQAIEKNEVEGSRAVSLLVSARKHGIQPAQSAGETALGEKCPCEA